MSSVVYLFCCRFGKLVREVPGIPCNEEWQSQQKCRDINTCSECVALNPQYKQAKHVSCYRTRLDFISLSLIQSVSCKIIHT